MVDLLAMAAKKGEKLKRTLRRRIAREGRLRRALRWRRRRTKRLAASAKARRSRQLARKLRKTTTAAHNATVVSRRRLANFRAKLRRRASNRLWGGSRFFTNRAIDIAKRHGVPVTSRKRPPFHYLSRRNPGSDHNASNLTADAVDLGTLTGEGLAYAIAREFGLGEKYSTGNFYSYYVRHNGRLYRIQILWGVADHYNHVHVGVRRA